MTEFVHKDIDPADLADIVDEGCVAEYGGRIVGYELVEDVDGNPAGVEYAGSGRWAVWTPRENER